MLEECSRAWKVYFQGNFWGKSGHGRAGKEFVMQQSFDWNGEHWLLAAMYLCGEGVVMDFCVEPDLERARAFMQKWKPLWESGKPLDEEVQGQILKENPLQIDFKAKLLCNRVELRAERSCAVVWIPSEYLPESFPNESVCPEILEHYGLDDSKFWAFHRVAFRWKTQRRPKIRQMKLCLERERTRVRGSKFLTPAVGESILLLHPHTGMEHRLTVLGIEPQKMNLSRLPQGNMTFPEYFVQMSYTLEPELSAWEFSLVDATPSDEPKIRRIEAQNSRNCSSQAESVAIIGGEDGPSAMFVSNCTQSGVLHIANSSFHFQPVEQVEWIPEFRWKPIDDCAVDLDLSGKEGV